MKDNVNKRLDEGWRIDELFRQGMEDLRPEPSENLWKGINRKLWWNEISHFTFTNLSKLLLIGGIALVMTLVTALMVVVVPPQSHHEEASLSIFTSEASASNGLAIPLSSMANPSSGQVEALTLPHDGSIAEENTRNQAASTPKITFAAILAAEEPEENTDHSLSGESSENSVAPAERSERQPDHEMITDIKPLHFDSYLLISGDHDLSGFVPSAVQNLGARPPVPSFFSLDLKVSPEATFNEINTEDVTWSFAGDMGLKFHFGRFSIGTGLGIDYEASEGIYAVDYISKDSVGYYTEVIFYSINDGDPNKVNFITRNVTVYDSITHIADDRTRNRYTYLQIPVLAGFRLLETSRLGLTAYAGPMVSFLVGKKEAEPVINYPNSRIIRIDNNTPARNKTTWQVLVGLRLDYKVANEFSVFAEPYYKYYLQPMVNQSESPAPNPWSVGLGVGLQYNFGRKTTAK